MPICAFSFYIYICKSSCHVINDNLSICCPPFSFWFTYKQVLSTTSLYMLDSRCRLICIIYAQFYLWFLVFSFFSYMDFYFRREILIYCIIVLVIWISCTKSAVFQSVALWYMSVCISFYASFCVCACVRVCVYCCVRLNFVCVCFYSRTIAVPANVFCWIWPDFK